MGSKFKTSMGWRLSSQTSLSIRKEMQLALDKSDIDASWSLM